jgi:serine/threonine-protein kinase
VDEFDAVPLVGTEGARNPFFSPNGEWIGFFAEGELRKVPSGGGAILRICDAPLDNLGSAWREDGTIVFASYATGLWRVAADGGDPEVLTQVDVESGETQHRWPQFLPGDRLLMTVGTTRGSRVAVVDLRDGRKSPVTDVTDVAVARYLPTGHLLFAQASALQVVPFDAAHTSLRGAPVTIVEGVTAVPTVGVSYFAVSDSGTLAYLPGTSEGGTRLVWVDSAGVVSPIGDRGGSHLMPRISPSGGSVALTVGRELGLRVIEILDLDRGSQRRLTFEGSNGMPVWSPDARRIVFSSSRDGGWNLYWRAADGSGEATRLLASENEIWPYDFSPDGKALAYWEIDPETGRDIWILPLEGEQTPIPFLVTRYNERAPVFSPDGRWMTYISDESGRDEVYVRPYPGPGGQTTVSTEGGVEPIWAPNGRRLFYRNADRMMVASVETEPTFSVSKPTILFEGRYERGVTGNLSYDVAPEGDRFLMIQPRGVRAKASFRVVLNWFDDVRRLSPAE